MPAAALYCRSTRAAITAAVLGLGCMSPAGDCPLADTDAPTEDPAGFYRCRDAQLNHGNGCGPDGYPLGFAAKYAEVYMWEVYPSVGQEAQAFLDANLLCLQSAFLEETSEDMTCAEVAEVGFESHPGCYLESGICGVPLVDQMAIVLSVEPMDMGHPSQQDAFVEIARMCFE